MGYKFYEHIQLIMRAISSSAINNDVSTWYSSLRELYRTISPWIKDDPAKKVYNRSIVEKLFQRAYTLINNPENVVMVAHVQEDTTNANYIRAVNYNKAAFFLDLIQTRLYDIMYQKNLFLPTKDDEGDDDWDMD